MGEIVNFDSSLRQGRPRLGKPSEGATILFFIGVRYERWDEAETAKKIAEPQRAPRTQRTKNPTIVTPGRSPRRKGRS